VEAYYEWDTQYQQYKSQILDYHYSNTGKRLKVYVADRSVEREVGWVNKSSNWQILSPNGEAFSRGNLWTPVSWSIIKGSKPSTSTPFPVFLGTKGSASVDDLEGTLAGGAQSGAKIGVFTDNTGYLINYNPCLNSQGDFAWTSWDGQDWEVYQCTQDTGATTQLTNNSYDNEIIQLNDQGQVVYGSYDGSHWQLYLYDAASGAHDNKIIQLNDNGQVLWQELHGAVDNIDSYSIYAFDGGAATKVGDFADNTDYGITREARLAANGDFYWESWDGGDYEVYGYDPQGHATTQLTDNAVDDRIVQINDNGQAVWQALTSSDYNLNDYDIYFYASVVSYARYDFTCYYNNGGGDYYTGAVYAATGDNGYEVGYTQAFTDENGQAGYYEITTVTDLGADGSQAGQVFVSSYYDQESGNTYTPVSHGAAVGTDYLGSENDYIIMDMAVDFLFGGGYYEADVGSYSMYQFTFCYNDGSGDYYIGLVYAPTSFQTSGPQLGVGACIYDQPMPMWGSYQGLNGGYYYIYAITDGFSSVWDKQSWISAYYDGDTAGATLGVSAYATTASYIFVPDRTAAYETGYAISGANHAAFDSYTEADVTLAASSPALLSAAPLPPSTDASLSAAQSQAVWGVYWGQTAGLWEEDDYR